MIGRLTFLCVCAALAVPAAARAETAIRVEASSGVALREWSSRIDQLLASGDLVVRLTRDDTMIPGRRHERLAQHYRGVPVFGGELARQSDETGTLTVFGTFYEGIDVSVAPALRPAEAEARLATRGGRPFGSRGGPELVVLPRQASGYRLAYRIRAFFEQSLDVRESFMDANTGELLREYSDIQTQVAGTGTGVLGEPEKVSVSPSSGGYVTTDRLRPPLISTYDFRFDVNRFVRFLDANGSPATFTSSDLGADSDNVWTDGALVDAHVFSGFVYDYYYKRHGRRGLDNANIAVHSVTHALRRDDWHYYSLPVILAYFANAFYLGDGVMYYGDGLPPDVNLYGQHVNYLAGALDIVAHELTHGVTDYSSRLIYEGESGALNEAFSDIMGTGVEFYFQPDKADYLAGEDVFAPGGIRSLANPMAFDDPDHYSIRYRGPADNGGVHHNSGIANNAFYLAIEGGRHRLGAMVHGVGSQNREQIERAFYRGFTAFLTPSATFSQARGATIHAARELYGAGSPAETALTQAWSAVGVE